MYKRLVDKKNIHNWSKLKKKFLRPVYYFTNTTCWKNIYCTLLFNTEIIYKAQTLIKFVY